MPTVAFSVAALQYGGPSGGAPALGCAACAAEPTYRASRCVPLLGRTASTVWSAHGNHERWVAMGPSGGNDGLCVLSFKRQPRSINGQ